jgi:ribosomal protein S18 acetylase RimI-like enzyme
MISYKRCSEVDIELVHNAFSIGFSDYIIKIQMPQEAFVSRFFGPEGNSLDTSFIALDGERPVGLILGGIKNYDGIKTMRCGTMAVDPEYRGIEVSKRLMELHREEAITQGCRQLFLEVIVGNDRAINFYKRLGYEKIYDLCYYSLNDFSKISNGTNSKAVIKAIGIEQLKKFAQRSSDVHINWQNDLDYIEKSDNQICLGAYLNDELIAVVSMNKNAKISYLYVDRKHRSSHIACSLILKAAEALNITKLSIGFPNNASIIGFLNHVGFKKDHISQYEMYLTLFN